MFTFSATGHDVIRYGEEESLVQNYDQTTSSTPLTTSAGTSEFATSMGMSETNGGVDITTSASNSPFNLNNLNSYPESK